VDYSQRLLASLTSGPATELFSQWLSEASASRQINGYMLEMERQRLHLRRFKGSEIQLTLSTAEINAVLVIS
jgi:hypothetical protein